MRWLPNAISILRGLAVVVVVVLLTPGTAAAALLVFVSAALSDALDGPVARRLRATSAFGAFVDPLADKMLVLGTLGGLLVRGAVDPAPVALIVARETAVTALRALAAGRALSVPSNAYGRAKASLQGAAVGGQLVALAWPALDLAAAADGLLWGAALVTVASGADVVRRAAATFAGSTPRALGAHAR